jgi:perosamine synthetase
LGSSQGGELDDIAMPRNYLKGLSTVQAREGLRALDHLDELLARRRKNAEIYTDFLEGKGKNHVARGLFPNHSFLKYPLRVNDRPTFQATAEKARVPLGDWFCSPLHPTRPPRLSEPFWYHIDRKAFYKQQTLQIFP